MAFDTFLIKNGKLWTGTEFITGNIRIEKDTIVSLDAAADAEAQYVYDAAGCMSAQGLWTFTRISTRSPGTCAAIPPSSSPRPSA